MALHSCFQPASLNSPHHSPTFTYWLIYILIDLYIDWFTYWLIYILIMLHIFVMFLFRCGLFQGTSLPPQEVPQMAVEHWQIAVWALFPFHLSDFFFFFFFFLWLQFLSKHLHSVCGICDGACRAGTGCTFFIRKPCWTELIIVWSRRVMPSLFHSYSCGVGSRITILY